MGMIQTLMKKTPDDKTPAQFCAEVDKRLPEFSEGADGAKCWILKPEEFDENWANEERLKKTPEIEAKYRALTAEGKVICVEIDW